MTDFKERIAAERLREFIRREGLGGCKMLSIGDACECLLCAVDFLARSRSSESGTTPADDTSQVATDTGHIVSVVQSVYQAQGNEL